MKDHHPPPQPAEPPNRQTAQPSRPRRNSPPTQSRSRFPARTNPSGRAAAAPTSEATPARREPAANTHAPEEPPQLTRDALLKMPVGGPNGRIDAVRHALGWKQSDFATAVGVSRETISHWENTDENGLPRQQPTRRNSKAIADLARQHLALDVDGALFFRDNRTSHTAQLADALNKAASHDQRLKAIEARLDQIIDLVSHSSPAPAEPDEQLTDEQLPTVEARALLAKPVRYRLRHARTAAKLTQQQLADTVGVDRIQIVHWEQGQSRPIRRYRQLIANATGFPLRFFDHDGRDGKS